MWGTAEPADLRATWAEELAGFEASDLRVALDAMRGIHLEYPPTLFQFAELCKAARARRAEATLKLPPPRARMPAHIAEMCRAFVKAKTVA